MHEPGHFLAHQTDSWSASGKMKQNLCIASNTSASAHSSVRMPLTERMLHRIHTHLSPWYRDPKPTMISASGVNTWTNFKLPYLAHSSKALRMSSAISSSPTCGDQFAKLHHGTFHQITTQFTQDPSDTFKRGKGEGRMVVLQLLLLYK